MKFLLSALVAMSALSFHEAKEDTSTENVREIAEWVFSKGGSVKYTNDDDKEVEIQDVDDLPEDSPITVVQLSEYEDIGNHQLKMIKDLPDLKTLNVLGSKCVNDNDLKEIGELTTLTTLVIAATSINGNGFRHLTDLESLQNLRCGGAPIRDVSLAPQENAQAQISRSG